MREQNNGAEPFFRIVRQGLNNDVDGEHFWDTVAEDAVFEFTYKFSGFPSQIKGKKNYMKWFEGYDRVLHSADNLRVHKAQDGKTIILEYSVHGTVRDSGKPYHNNFCSIITIQDRKVVHWRDYMDSLAVISSIS